MMQATPTSRPRDENSHAESSPDDSDHQVFWRDLVIVALLVLCAAALFTHIELNEWLFDRTREWETMQVDELLPVMAVFAMAFSWFAWRRYRHAREELIKRRLAEGRLAVLLVENRRLAQQYLQAQEAERKSLARELHDELGQYLNAIKTDAVSIQSQVNGPASAPVSAIISHTDHLHAVVRDLIRDLRPVGLDDLGLQAALEHLLDHCRQRMPGVKIDAALAGELDALDEPINLAIYRLTQEAMTNVSKHAQASRVTIRVARTGAPNDMVIFNISDDGRGNDPNQAHGGLGLIGMRERVEMLGGEWQIATSPGQGFSLSAAIPLGEPARSKA